MSTVGERERKRAIWAWTMYDWADSSFATTIMATVLPIFYFDVAAKGVPGASFYWGYTQSIAMAVVAFLAPILGAIADHTCAKKRFLRFFVILGVIGTALLAFVGEGGYLWCSLVYILGMIGFSGGNIFYDAFLPEIAKPEEIDYISSKGYALGYLGGGLLLAVNLAMIMKPRWFFLPDGLAATRLAFLSVAVWWFVFSLPLFRYVHESQTTITKERCNYVKVAFSRIGTTFREIRKYKELTKFLVAFWLYNDGIGTIMKMATIYGKEVGIGNVHLIGALLLTQFVGIPFSLLFGKLPRKLGTKNSLYVGIGIYTLITIVGYFMDSALEFWVLAFLVGIVQGGTQALSRSLYGSMLPKDKNAEFFGFMGISSKFATIFGPFIFAFTGQLLGSSRFGIISLVIFFILGGLMLATVNVSEGRKLANGTAGSRTTVAG